MNQENFFPRVWELVAEIPYGRVATYGQLADMLGYPRHARLVGAAMRYAPEDLPCHRVTAGDGRCAPHWPEQQILLRQEGVAILPGGKADLAHFRWQGL
ncbi:MAG: methylated-DNA--[protein]-cysteine S-methyltransferase [Oscillospiraceae bacterium]|nr:methylated-DNA--[protein]-cysteine S-methyltransferase [Oscillospiraceae bacterium]